MHDVFARFLCHCPRLTRIIAGTPLRCSQRNSTQNPIVLLHGFSDSAVAMDVMSQRLTAAGRVVHTKTLQPSDGTVSIVELAEQLADHINMISPRCRIDLIGFSMGGLVARYLVQNLDFTCRVERLVTIATPHRGTRLAHLSRKPGCVEMRPGSAFLTALNSDLTRLQRIHFMSLSTPLDLVIVPASGSRINVGRQVRIWAAAHPLMILQGRSLDAVEHFLSSDARMEPAIGFEPMTC